jgi:hypothetical protein
VRGWGPAPSTKRAYYEFNVLRGCPFDVILGYAFLDETATFVNHFDSMHEIVKDITLGLSIVVWVKAKFRKDASSPEVQEQDKRKRERDAEFERRAATEWHTNNWYSVPGGVVTLDPIRNVRPVTTPTLHHKHGNVGSVSNSTTSSAPSRSNLKRVSKST